MDDFSDARKNMVERQLVARGIRDRRVLQAMEELPRDLFVDQDSVSEAYHDNPLPIGYGQTISQPYMVAIMTELLALEGHERVLEIGTGSGYQTAILARLCLRVFTIERITSLAHKAENVLSQCGYTNISLMVGDGTEGWSSEAPFDGIIVTAGAPKVPQTLVDQLCEGGRLIIPVGDRFSQILKRATRVRDGIKIESHTSCRFVDLVGQHGWSLS
ncbi:MAG: protein-L-isoaspartate(D-aspartate) O-methyltransferase [Desulfomonile sp.]